MDTKSKPDVDSLIDQVTSSSVAYKIGKVLYYYDITKMAIVELTSDIGVGEKVVFKNANISIEHTLKTIKIGYSNVDEAQKGQTIAIQIDKKIRPGMEVFRL